MTYEEFISDLPSERSIVFRSVEENEEMMTRLGVDQQIRQLGKGAFLIGVRCRFSTFSQVMRNAAPDPKNLVQEITRAQAATPILRCR